MFIIMAIKAKQLPVAAVGRVVVVVMVAVVDREHPQLPAAEIAAAAPADMRKQFQGPLAITLFPLLPVAAGVSHHLRQPL